jgi:hypothetical protein
MDTFRRPVPIRDGQCSLCNGHANKLKSHLAQHLEQIALFALPRPAPTTELGLSHQVLADLDGRGSGDRGETNSRAGSFGTFHSGPGDNMGSGNLSLSGEQPDNENGNGDGIEAAVAGDSVCVDQQASPKLPVLPGDSPGSAQLSPLDEYALDLQGIAKLELENLGLLKAIREANWGSLLEAAPTVVYTMATLLRTSSEKAVAGLEILSQEITGKDGKINELLPNKLFHPNIQYCTGLGSSVFRNSEWIMDWVCSTVNRYMNDSINLIIDLLKHPDDAVVHRFAIIERVHESTQECLAKIKRLCKRFESWCLVIGFLRDTTMEAEGMCFVPWPLRRIQHQVT